jgi:putative transposase
VLDRHGLVQRRRRRRNRATGTALSAANEPNELWCADYKGEFMLADGWIDRRVWTPMHPV